MISLPDHPRLGSARRPVGRRDLVIFG